MGRRYPAAPAVDPPDGPVAMDDAELVVPHAGPIGCLVRPYDALAIVRMDQTREVVRLRNQLFRRVAKELVRLGAHEDVPGPPGALVDRVGPWDRGHAVNQLAQDRVLSSKRVFGRAAGRHVQHHALEPDRAADLVAFDAASTV